MGENTAALKAPRRRTQCHSRAVLVDLLNLLSTDRGDAATRLDDDALAKTRLTRYHPSVFGPQSAKAMVLVE